MGQPIKRSQIRPRTQERRPARRAVGSGSTPPGRPRRTWLGPLVVVVAILALAIVALPGLGPGPGSTAPHGTSRPVGTTAGPTAQDVAVAATGTPSAIDAPPTADPPTDPATDPTTETPQPAASGQAYPRPVTALRKRLDRAFKQMAKEIGSPGLVAAVKLPDGSVWYGSDGVLWPGGPRVTAGTPFAWGSITKTFVAALTLRAATAGQISLDQTIDAWLPQIPNANLITVRMLLAHRSGLFDYFQSKEYGKRVFSDPTHVWTLDEILAMIGPSVYPPGTGFNYSNTNYILLGLILEQVTGQPLATLIHDQLLVPLGMDHSVFQQAGQPVDLVGAKGFWKSGTGFQEWSDDTNFRPTTSTATVAWAAGAMEGSARDLLDWEMALYGGQVLTPAELAEMLGTYRDSGYGLGARTQTLDGQQGYGHGGSLRGFVSVMYRLPVADLDVVVLANVGFANLDKVANRLAKAALNPLPTPQPSGAPSVAPLPSGAP